jgi:NitT/TauT family transport system ATP-binding protein
VEEALLLSQRVLIFSQRPARIVKTVTVDLPYPRHRDDPQLIALRRERLSQMNLAQET